MALRVTTSDFTIDESFTWLRAAIPTPRGSHYPRTNAGLKTYKLVAGDMQMCLSLSTYVRAQANQNLMVGSAKAVFPTTGKR